MFFGRFAYDDLLDDAFLFSYHRLLFYFCTLDGRFHDFVSVADRAIYGTTLDVHMFTAEPDGVFNRFSVCLP